MEEIAPTDDKAASQAASLATLVTLARGFTVPLSDNAANNGLKELLKTAEVDPERNRVVVTATVPASMLASWLDGENSAVQTEPAPASDASK